MPKILPYQRLVLSNKLTVLLFPIESLMSTFAVLYVRVGAIYEKPNERGISHFTEHAAYLGTKQHETGLELSRIAEEMGAVFDGRTGKSETQYWVKLPHTNLEKGIELLHQLVFAPLLDERHILAERNVIVSEFNDFWHNPDRRFEHEAWRKRFKQKEHPYSYRPMGIPQTINNLDKRQVLAWRNKYYHPANMVLSIAGNLSKNKQVSEFIANDFGKGEGGKEAKEPKFNPNDYSNFSLYLQDDPRPQIRFIITFPAFGWRQFPRRKRLELGLLNRVFGGGRTSRLNQRLREKERLVYRAGTNFNLHPWMGGFEIWSSTSAEKVVSSISAVKEEIDKLVKNGVTEEEVSHAKSFMTASTLLKFDNPESIAHYFASQEFNDEEIWLPEKYIEEGEKITKNELNGLTKEIFVYPKVNINLLGKVPSPTLKEIEKIFKN